MRQIPHKAVAYRETIRLPGDVEATYVPAGHVLGSAQILLEHAGERIVIVTGDYKRRARSHLPCALRTCAVRHLHHRSDLRPAGLLATRRSRKRSAKLLEARRAPAKLPFWWAPMLWARRSAFLKGEIVMAPPSALNDRWSRRLPEPLTAMASGWMTVRQRATQRGAELPLVISDHADWDELTRTIEEVAAPEVWVTHGREDALVPVPIAPPGPCPCWAAATKTTRPPRVPNWPAS